VSELALRCVELDAASVDAVTELFVHEGSTCYCRYHHFNGDKNAWLARLFHEPELNAREFRETAGSSELQGMVALADDGSALGWMKVTDHRALTKHYQQRLYRDLPCFGGPRDGIFTVGCFLIDERFRRRGVARALLRAGVDAVRAAGGRAIEAFPRGTPDVSAAELWTGPVALFTSEGFDVVHDFAPYPVLRRTL